MIDRPTRHARIEDYAFLSDMESAALVSHVGSIDWLCWPRFDSAACFAALLHDPSAGRWALAPAERLRAVERRYRKDTLILETEFSCDSGRVRLVDCLAVEEKAVVDDELSTYSARAPRHVLVRQLEGIDGEVPVTMDFRPRLDYGSVVPWFRNLDAGVEAVGGPDALDLTSPVELRISDGAVTADFVVRARDTIPFVLSYHPSHEEVPFASPDQAAAFIERTEQVWKAWANETSYQGPWREEVVRSLLTLKGLTYAPSGGVVAAPTASLPEELGSSRNWDYRYCWLRDATFTLDALLEYGYTPAARRWRDWLLRAVAGDPEDMQIMYGVLGERRLLEYELPLDGYEGSQPVRVGNAAHKQFQLDVYGEVMDSFHSARRAGIETPQHAWDLEKVIVDHVCERWQQPDEGIWEVRSDPEHFVHSKVMAWVAVDRGIKAVEMFAKDGPVERWSATRAEIRAEILDRGVDHNLGRFKRSYSSAELDASLLMLPVVGFIEAKDPIMARTVEAIQEELVIDGFVYRYRSDVVDDGLPPGEATFLMCSFWLVDCLVMLGRSNEAEELFERLIATANDLHLLSEQYDPRRKRLLGNFPQAFSHVALVSAAAALRSAGRARAVRRGKR